VFNSVRIRLTLWYSLVLACTLVFLAGVVYWIVASSMMARTDADLAQLADSFLVTFDDELNDASNSSGITGAADQSIVEHRYRDHVFAIVDSHGAVVAKSSDLTEAKERDHADSGVLLSSVAFDKFAKTAWTSDRSFEIIHAPHGVYRGYARRFTAKQQPFDLLILRSLHAQNETLEKLRLAFAWVIPLGLLLAASGGYFLAHKTLAPVAAMGVQAGSITSANLHKRLSVQNPGDELGRLAFSFNSLLDRLDQSFDRQRRFIADASHELRTPVAILSGEAEVALSQNTRTSEEYRDSLNSVHQEANRLSRIVEDLFTLTRADSGQYPLSLQDFYLDELVASCVHSARTLALAKNITLTMNAPGELPIRADESLLRRLLLNLIDNAVKYTPPGGRITVESTTVPEGYEVTVSDTGPGIPEELGSRIFERFFRADPARSRAANGGGAGLGLSIALWIAEAHHGRLRLVRSDTTGSTFSVFLPARSSAGY
jgi:two-component system, OmpR family, sensor kinase